MIAKLLLDTLIASIALTVRPLLSYLRAVGNRKFLHGSRTPHKTPLGGLK